MNDDEKFAYDVAKYVGIPGEALTRWLGAMKMCGYQLTRTTGELTGQALKNTEKPDEQTQ